MTKLEGDTPFQKERPRLLSPRYTKKIRLNKGGCKQE